MRGAAGGERASPTCSTAYCCKQIFIAVLSSALINAPYYIFFFFHGTSVHETDLSFVSEMRSIKSLSRTFSVLRKILSTFVALFLMLNFPRRCHHAFLTNKLISGVAHAVTLLLKDDHSPAYCSVPLSSRSQQQPDIPDAFCLHSKWPQPPAVSNL